jgi:hypothetical protein
MGEENPMPKHARRFAILAFAAEVVIGGAASVRAEAGRSHYPAMAPLDQYLMSDEGSEIELARSAAPRSVSDIAEVMVLGRKGYTTVAKGGNDFVCLVERSWGASTDDPEFWNPKVRAPICFNPAARRTVVPIYLLKTRLILEGRSTSEIVHLVAAALDAGELPALEPGAMCYMMSKRQYLSDQGMSWHPHLMFFVAGAAASSWGANLSDSPVMAANDPEERLTVFLVWVGQWSDGTPAPPITH